MRHEQSTMPIQGYRWRRHQRQPREVFMRYKIFSERTGLKVSELALGTSAEHSFREEKSKVKEANMKNLRNSNSKAELRRLMNGKA
jgi:hypothetical protein